MNKLGNKTPVSYLQEKLQLEYKCPKYELVFDGTQTKRPLFTFMVQVGDHKQEGSGKNKKEAKHKAAENMLKALKLISDNPKGEEKDRVDTFDPLENYVGLVKEYCLAHGYPRPVYKLEESAGPAHSKVFKMVCWVSHIRRDGVARTKKGAKRIAAARMLQELQRCVRDSPAPKKTIAISKGEDKVLEKYRNLKIAVSQNAQSNLAYYKDHHNAYLTLDSPTLSRLVKNSSAITAGESVQLATDIAKELQVKLFYKILTSISGGKLISVSMDLIPPLTEIDIDFNQAVSKLLKTLVILATPIEQFKTTQLFL